MTELCEIHTGDCREMLRRLPAESVQCCVTSPPYWGLRDYGVPTSVWGGKADCPHEWGEWVREPVTDGKTRTTDRCYGAGDCHRTFVIPRHTAGAFCALCSAWRPNECSWAEDIQREERPGLSAGDGTPKDFDHSGISKSKPSYLQGNAIQPSLDDQREKEKSSVEQKETSKGCD